MSYSTSNPPRLVDSAGLYGAGQTWEYVSADPKATVDDAGYITNALALGMKVGDIVVVNDTATPMISLHRLTAVDASGSTLSAGLNIT